MTERPVASASRTAALYVATFSLLWAVLPTLLFPNPPLDVVEGFAWGRDLALGYTKHPPLQAWLLEASFHLTGGHAFGAYWLSQICFVLAYFFIWNLARDVGLSRQQSLWALVATSCSFYFTLPAPEFNPNILQIPVWAGMLLFFHRALRQGATRDWLMLGLLAAAGLYAKYFAALLIGSIGLYALVFSDARRCLKTPGPYVAMATGALLFIPHVYWLIETQWLTFTYAANRSMPAETWLDHLLYPVNFLAGQIGSLAPVLLVLAAGLGLSGLRALPRAKPNLAAVPGTQLDLRFLLWFTLVPLAVVLLVSGVTGREFKQMWGASMFTLIGIVLVQLVAHRTAVWSLRRALGAAVAIQFLFLGVVTGQALVEPMFKSKPTRIHFPGDALARAVTDAWRQATDLPLAFVAGDMWPAAHVTLFSPDRPSLFTDHTAAIAPWIDTQDVQRRGVLVLWTGDSDTPTGTLADIYPNRIRDGFADVPYAAPANWPPLRVNWIIVPPGQVPGL
ncbi:MAG: glycosyltransferase family 39 protein [Pannonibacter sp.]